MKKWAGELEYRELGSRAGQRVLRWFGHVERMDEYVMTRRVLMVELSGGRVRGRPRLGWMPFATEVWLWRLRDNARKIGKSGEPWYICNWMSFTGPFLLGPVFFRTALPCSAGYHLEVGGMPLHDAVGINCKKGATTENQGAGVKHMVVPFMPLLLMGVCLMIVCLLSDLIWLPLLGGGRKSWYIIIIFAYWLGSDRLSELLVFFVPASLLFLCLMLFLLFPCASVWENTRARVSHSYSHTEWYFLFFRQCNYKCTMCSRSEKV